MAVSPHARPDEEPLPPRSSRMQLVMVVASMLALGVLVSVALLQILERS